MSATVAQRKKAVNKKTADNMKKRKDTKLSERIEFKLRNPYLLICAVLAITVLLEIFLFNYKFFTTLSAEPIELSYNDAIFGDGLALHEDGSFSTRESGERTIEFRGLNVKIDSVYFNIQNALYQVNRDLVNDEKQNVNVTFFVTDEANELYYALSPSKDINRSIAKSSYAALYTSGISNSIKIRINGQPGERYGIIGVTLNPKRPLFFSPLRCLIVFLTLLLFAVGASSFHSRHVFDPKSVAQRAITATAAAAVSAIFIMMILANTFWHNQYWGDTTQYIEQTNALLDGHAYLDAEPPQFLKDMENPYDSDYRIMLANEAGATVLWDHAYYNGRYYSYFGVTPVILLNIPYKLLTGTDFSSSWSVCVFSVVFAIGAFLLVGAIVKRWFSSISYFFYLVLSLCLIVIPNIFNYLSIPNVYSIPFVSSLAFIMFALYFWISAGEGDKAKNIKICLGSLCAALTAGCRPQFLLAAALAVPLLWKALIPQEKGGAWRERVPSLAAFAVPFIVVGILMMYYNYIRFESVFNFGAAYNMTTNDMTRRGFVAARIPLSLWKFFFQPANLSLEFPYIQNASNYTGFMIKTIIEPTYGGIFNHAFLLFNILIFKFKAQLKEKKLFAFSVICVVFAFIIAIFDAQFAGITHRYSTDFSYLLFLPALIIALHLYEHASEKQRRYLRLFVCFCLVSSVCFSILPIAKETWRLCWNAKEPNIYYMMKNAWEFWQ